MTRWALIRESRIWARAPGLRYLWKGSGSDLVGEEEEKGLVDALILRFMVNEERERERESGALRKWSSEREGVFILK